MSQKNFGPKACLCQASRARPFSLSFSDILPLMQAFGLSIVNGFCFGSGLILAAAFFKVALHMGFCN